MPENINELLWWALNGSILIVAFYIRGDLKEIKQGLKDGTKVFNDHEKRIVRLEVRCNMQHGENGENQPHTHIRNTDIDEGH